MKTAEVVRQASQKMEDVIRGLLSEATCYVEVQKDAPYKEHPAHTHPTDEVLHILEGKIFFTIDDRQIPCCKDDRLFLPKDTLHASKAGKNGCLYVISIKK